MKTAGFVLALGMLLTACSSGSSDEEKRGTVEAPMLMGVEPMEGALHVMWMNMETSGESVEAERKMEGGDYEVAFTVPGSVDNKMDAAATDDMTYTYRLRCKMGGMYSAYSNEMSANPHDM